MGSAPPQKKQPSVQGGGCPEEPGEKGPEILRGVTGGGAAAGTHPPPAPERARLGRPCKNCSEVHFFF